MPARPLLAARPPPGSEAGVTACASPHTHPSLPGTRFLAARTAKEGPGCHLRARHLPSGIPREPEEGQVRLRALPRAIGGSAEVRHRRPPAGRPSAPLPASSGQPARPSGPGRGARPAGRLGRAGAPGEGRAGGKQRGAGGAPRSEAELGTRLHSAVSGREDLPPPPPLVHLPPARDAAASFPQCTPAPGGALSSLSLPPPPLPFRRLL